MEIARVHPQLRAQIARLPDMTQVLVHPPRLRAARLAVRLMPAGRLPAGVALRRVRLGPDHGAYVVTPDRPTGAGLLWIHGGGMVMGAPRQDQARCARLAAQLGLVVVSVDYRLAPEHPYPTPLDDCQQAWTWLVDQSEQLGIDPGRLAIGGQSAGAGLAAGLVLRLRDAGGAQPAAQWLFCPMLDDRVAARTDLDQVNHFVWNNTSNRAGWSAYLGTLGPPGAPGVPAEAAPARGQDLTGLPPAWIGTGTVELFRDEDRAYADALARCGVASLLDEVVGAPHGFEVIVPDAPVAQAYLARAEDWLAEQLGLAPGASAVTPLA
jgi:acetyl esterase/lipase